MVKNNYLFLIVGFIFIIDVCCGDRLKKPVALQDDFWGRQITSPQVSPGGDAICSNALSSDNETEKVSPASLNSGAISPEWVGLVANTAKVVTYKQAIGTELDRLEGALKSSAFDFSEISETLSPCARIRALTKRIVETKEVEDFMSECQKKNKWPGEEHRFIGSSVASAHECHDLVKQLGNNGVARVLIGASFLVSLYLYRKK